ncbi:hypothetical protein KC332_g31 [Hortaea werneckii]|nr:hypothetical protein KC332_g31 [Hortaea werneckii]
MDPSILVQETIRNSQCVQGAVVMEAVRPSLEKTSVKNGRFIMIGILAGINSGQRPLMNTSEESTIYKTILHPAVTSFTYPSSSTQGETPRRRHHAVPEEQRGPVQRLCDSVPESQAACGNEQGRDDQQVESRLRLEDSRVLLAAPIGVAVYEPSAEPGSDEVSDQTWNDEGAENVEGEDPSKGYGVAESRIEYRRVHNQWERSEEELHIVFLRMGSLLERSTPGSISFDRELRVFSTGAPAPSSFDECDGDGGSLLLPIGVPCGV